MELVGMIQGDKSSKTALIMPKDKRRRGVSPFQDLTRLFRRPWMEVVLVLSCVCGLVHYGATKGTNGLDGDNDGITTCFLVLG